MGMYYCKQRMNLKGSTALAVMYGHQANALKNSLNGETVQC